MTLLHNGVMMITERCIISFICLYCCLSAVRTRNRELLSRMPYTVRRRSRSSFILDEQTMRAYEIPTDYFAKSQANQKLYPLFVIYFSN